MLMVPKQQFIDIYHARARSTFCFDEHYHQQSILASFPFYTWDSTINSNYDFGEWVFRTLFILNASLAAIATIASITMIKHKNLTRGDEEQFKCQGNNLASAEKSSPISPIEGDIKRAVP